MSHAKPEYSGIDKYPGVIATIVTVIIGAVFLGGLYVNAGSGGHHAEGGAAPAAEGTAAPAAEGAAH